MNVCCVRPLTLSLLAGCAICSVAALGFGLGRLSHRTAPLVIPQIDATASATSDEFSLATGLVSSEAEGVFVLDHSTGLLQCNVLYPRSGQFGAAFQANVKEALGGGGKNTKYLMVTGTASFPGNSSRGGAANCVVYVLDTTTGTYACYGIPFNESMVNRAPQMGAMLLMATGMARQALDRDALR